MANRPARSRRRIGLMAAAGLAALGLLSCEESGVPSDPAGWEDSGGPWNGAAAAFTFSSDDGNDDNLVWAEIYKQAGLRFTIFVVPRRLGRPGKLTAQDLCQLDAEGFEIGGHSMTHRRLASLDDQQLVFELKACRDTLERIITRRDCLCRSFAYPYHDHDRRVMAAAGSLYAVARDGGWPPDTRGSVRGPQPGTTPLCTRSPS